MRHLNVEQRDITVILTKNFFLKKKLKKGRYNVEVVSLIQN